MSLEEQGAGASGQADQYSDWEQIDVPVGVSGQVGDQVNVAADDALAFDASPEVTDEEDERAELPRNDIFKKLWPHLSTPLIPMLFGGITCLLVLPLLVAGRTQLPPVALWPVTLVIVAIALAQGVALYYSGDNNGLWAVSNVGAFCLFLLVGTLVIFGPIPGIVLLIIFVVAAIVLGRVYLAPVPEGFVEIVYSFGKYSRTLEPGFNIRLPWEKIQRELNTAETQWSCPPQRVQMSRTEDVILRATVSYQLLPKEAYRAVTQVNRWEESLQEVCITTLQTIVTTFSPDDLIVWQQGLHSRSKSTNHSPTSVARWQQVNAYLFDQILGRVSPWGVQLNWVRIHDMELIPHGAPIADEVIKVKASMASSQPASLPKDVTEPDIAAPSKAQQAPVQPSPVVPPVSAPSARSHTFTLPKTLKDEDLDKVLTGVYNQVRDGRITDPETILGIADTFTTLAQDAEKSKLLSFDVNRAIRNLYAQAHKYEDLYATAAIYRDETKPDWPMRRNSDDNLMAGG